MKPGFYTIPLTGLKEGEHHYDFKIDDEFFSGFEDSEIKKGDIAAMVKLVKRSAHMEVTIRLEGAVEVACDRCLGNYLQEINIEERIYVQFGPHLEEIDDRVIMIPYGESNLDLGQLFYEFSHLGLPLQRIHKKGKDGKSGCNPEMIKRLMEQDTLNEETDPRWIELNKLKDNILN